MSHTAITRIESAPLSTTAAVGVAANHYAQAAAFTDYLSRKAERTVASHRQDLATFVEFLYSAGLTTPTPDALQQNAELWGAITWGLVAAFVQWLLKAGYATASIGRKLSTIKVYARLATQVGAMSAEELARIKTVKAYAGKEARRIDRAREIADVDTRIGDKKAEPTRISRAQAIRLKEQPDTPEGRRDRLLVCLLLDHGLRISEVALLNREDFDLSAGLVHFYRPKVDKAQIHELSDDTLLALEAYIAAGDCPERGSIWRQATREGGLGAQGLSTRSLSRRVRMLGEAVGLLQLSPHDCRHYWASYWAKRVDLFRLQEAGGWSSLEMPRRYTEAAAVANVGMK